MSERSDACRRAYEKLLEATPDAVLAQRQQDKHHHGYRQQQKRIRTLIAFNDLFVEAVLAMSSEGLVGLADRIFKDMKKTCKRYKTPCFSEEQFQAIVQGLSREVAIFLGVHQEGLAARMTSRIDDGLGVDMQIIDPASRRYINLDCKSPSAYRHRLYDLVREGRLDESTQNRAMQEGFVQIKNGHGANTFFVILMEISEEEFGSITDFTFESTHVLGDKMKEIIEQYGRNDNGYGKQIGESV